MFDITQVIVAVTIVILTSLLTVLGIEVFYILKDVRKMLDRVNGALDDAEEIIDHVKKPTQMIASISHSAELVGKILETIKPAEQPKAEPVTHTIVVEKHISEPEAIEAKVQEKQMPVQNPATLGRRFFRMPRRPVS